MVLTKANQRCKLKGPARSRETALDLGCGDGTFHDILIHNDVAVDAVDQAEQSFDSDKITFYQEALETFNPPRIYGLVLARYTLHFLDAADAKTVVRRVKQATRSGGHHLLICLDERELAHPSTGDPTPTNFYPSKEDLQMLYEGWTIQALSKHLTEQEEHDGFDPHQHKVTMLIAQHPS